MLTYHPALWAPLLRLEEGNEVTPHITPLNYHLVTYYYIN